MTGGRTAADGTVAWPDDVAERYVAAGHWTGVPLAERFRSVVGSRPAAIALVDGEVRLTYAEVWRRALAAAARMARLGLRAGDRIVVQLPNRWEFVILTLACLRLGVVPVMALPAHRRSELAHVVAHSGAKAIAVPGVVKGFDHQAMANELVREHPGLERVLVAAEDVRHGGVSLTEMCLPGAEAGTGPDAADLPPPPDARAAAVFLLSGGTTGPPKLIPRTHDDYGCGIDHSARACRFGPDTVFLAALPAAHNFTLAGPGVLGTLLSGGRVVLCTSPDPAAVFPLVERERVTVTGAVPASVQRWLDFHRSGHGHDLSSLEILQVGGARLADELARKIAPTLGCALQQGYGMAEGLICITRPDDPEELACRTQGAPVCPDDELRLVDGEGRPVPDGEPGILLTRGPYTIRGYYRAEEHNDRAFTEDGWYNTGDIVRLRPDGYLVVEGRDKDVINRAGEKIAAEEVEEHAYRVEGVGVAAAVAMPDPVLGERVCLYVVPRNGAGRGLRLEMFVEAMERAGVARYKLPERLVLTDDLPLTAVGKIDKRALRHDIERRIGSEPAG
ncbi:2,3-dihydroxybenzoate-AMP ligase [Actinomadura sp. CNU-125]|uniref:(2,3-dihydroxybenzoyl)adenylate synthase n=1 Tax=Actinomadura sp. CNU-125 TaxID=1904961 RepID=UPI00096558AB|nr:AMP-binding protein [Actinomadura sp. CNU-125]OLT19117.1 2,3-dihydroxybenzoate-AMP ligase [Actinomadura sp. CNU-125]